jgi:coenzyme F420-0:L-glutamate ligase/coenzyme F420-1:gamma-L-glutamate ligase
MGPARGDLERARYPRSSATTSWFQLGDRDLGLHLVRTKALRAGEPLSAVTARVAAAFGVRVRVLPATDDRLRTVVETPAGAFSLQEWFVGRRSRDSVDGVRFDGAASAKPAPGVLEAIDRSSVVVIAPSNPYISVWPILAVRGIRRAVERARVPVVGVSPVIGGKAVKGPADRMLRRIAGGTTPAHVAAAIPADRRARPRPGGRVRREEVDAAGVRVRDPHADEGPGRHAFSPQPSSTRPRAGDAPVIGSSPSRSPRDRRGDDLAALIAAAVELRDGDVVCVAQKVVSKAEGRVVRLADIEPSDEARELAGPDGDPRRLEVVLRESARVVRSRPPLVIAETRHGFVCAAAGVDASNAPAPEMVVLLPEDPDASAARLREGLEERSGRSLGVIVTDTFGRAWRLGITNVAIGASGVEVLRDLSGVHDPTGYELHSTVIALADEIAAAAELVMGKTERIPAAVVRGVAVSGSGTASDLLMPPGHDLFR